MQMTKRRSVIKAFLGCLAGLFAIKSSQGKPMSSSLAAPEKLPSETSDAPDLIVTYDIPFKEIAKTSNGLILRGVTNADIRFNVTQSFGPGSSGRWRVFISLASGDERVVERRSKDSLSRYCSGLFPHPSTINTEAAETPQK